MSDNNNENQQPKTLKVPASIDAIKPQQQQPAAPQAQPPQQPQQEGQGQQQATEGSATATDIQGNTNVSRGIIGLVTQPNPGYITEGTVADKVNPATRFQKSGKPNPLTEEDLQKRMDAEREKAGMNSEIQEQRVIKIRTEMQGFKYTPPQGMENIPELAPTPDYTQEKEPNPDASQNESQVDVQSSQ